MFLSVERIIIMRLLLMILVFLNPYITSRANRSRSRNLVTLGKLSIPGRQV
jgi:hypothetical protein